MALGEEGLGVGVEIVPGRAEMVVDRVEIDHQPEPVGGVDQALEIVRAAVGAVGGVGLHAVVAPVARALEVGERQQLDGGDAERLEVGQPRLQAGIGALRRRGADMALVDHRLLERPPGPGLVGPFEGARVDDLAEARDVLRLEARGGVGGDEVAVDAEAVAGAGLHPGQGGATPAAAGFGQGMVDAVDDEVDALGGGRPEGEADAALDHLGPEFHAVGAPHRATVLVIGRAHRGASAAGSTSGGRRPRARSGSRSAAMAGWACGNGDAGDLRARSPSPGTREPRSGHPPGTASRARAPSTAHPTGPAATPKETSKETSRSFDGALGRGRCLWDVGSRQAGTREGRDLPEGAADARAGPARAPTRSSRPGPLPAPAPVLRPGAVSTRTVRPGSGTAAPAG